MPRPPKQVPANTLGGRIRAAREHLHLSLAAVAEGHYSTSLISQIERNRVDPSEKSLEFLAEKLQLPLEDLKLLAQQHRESEVEAHQFKVFDELRAQAAQLVKERHSGQALDLLKNLNILQVPPMLRWRIMALRGHCYFNQRQFLAAQRDFLYAATERPAVIPEDQQQEVMTLHLYLAATHRELEQLDEAFKQYQVALEMMSHSTPFGYVAEAHWGLALIAFSRANQMCPESSPCRERELRTALEHAENACILSRSIGETLRAASLTCLIGMIEQAMGNVEGATKRLQDLLNTWAPMLDEPATDKRRRQEQANVVSAAACSLAAIELEAKHCDQALFYAQLAWQAGVQSYILRRADAKMMLGRILETQQPDDPAAEQAFRDAIAELAGTDRIAARIRAHDYLGRHLLKKNRTLEGEQELDRARHLSTLASAFGSDTISAEDNH
jgi:transcriptional regulator with XRE-family HTH domain